MSAETIHFFGKRFDGNKIGRFAMSCDDEEFDALMNELDGELPRGYMVWHIPQAEIEAGSKRIERLKEYPYVVQTTFLGTHNAIVRDVLLREKKEQAFQDQWDAEAAEIIYSRDQVAKATLDALKVNHDDEKWDVIDRDLLISKTLRDERLKRPANDMDGSLLKVVIDENLNRMKNRG